MPADSRIFRLSLLCFLLHAIFLSAQNEKYEEFIHNNRIYKPGCNFFTIESGAGFNPSLNTIESSSALSYSFRVNNTYIRIGYHSSGNKFFTQRSYQKLNDIFGIFGYRTENMKYNFSVFGGPSYAYGAKYHHTDSLGMKWYKVFGNIGLFACASLSYKFLYDIGAGLSVFCSYNKDYMVAGLKINIFFSGAFKGQIK